MDIKYLILKSIYSTLSDSERHELNTWLEEGRNASLYERIKNNLKARDAVHFLANVDVERALRRVHCNRRKPLITFISTIKFIYFCFNFFFTVKINFSCHYLFLFNTINSPLQYKTKNFPNFILSFFYSKFFTNFYIIILSFNTTCLSMNFKIIQKN